MVLTDLLEALIIWQAVHENAKVEKDRRTLMEPNRDWTTGAETSVIPDVLDAESALKSTCWWGSTRGRVLAVDILIEVHQLFQSNRCLMKRHRELTHRVLRRG